MTTASLALEATRSGDGRVANIGAGIHCWVLSATDSDPDARQISAARNHYERFQEDFGDLDSMLKLGELLNNLQS